MKKDLITIIINVYNGEKYVKKCLDSVINQTYSDLEILIINDGSTDKTLRIIKEYKDDRIRIITTKNLGLSLSRNIGLDNAKGDYLYFIDADDFIEKDTIKYLYTLSKKYSADISTSQVLDIYNYNFKVKNANEEISILKGIDLLKKILLSLDRSGTIWNKLFKKEIFNDLRFEDRIINDMAILYKIALKINKCVFSNQIKYYYLKNENSITGKHRNDRAIDEYNVSIERYNYIKNILDLDENIIGLLHSIVMVYNHNNVTVENFLKKTNSRKLFNNSFSLKKVLNSSIKRKEKIKIILYRISPKLERILQKIYIKRKLKHNKYK